MFDIGFWELGIIALLALLVVGPERLPRLARTTGLWLSRGRRTIQNIKDEIDREIQGSDIKTAAEEGARNPLGQAIGETADSLRVLKRDTEKVMNDTKSQFEGKKTDKQEDSPAPSD